MHRQSASLTVDAYTKAGGSQQPFYCLHCIVSLQKQEIDLLKERVKSLSVKLDSLLPNSTSTSNNTSQNVSQLSTSKNENQPQSVRPSFQPLDCKFNLVIYGIKESPGGTSWSDRVKHDVDSSVSILTKIKVTSTLLQLEIVSDLANISKTKVALSLFY